MTGEPEPEDRRAQITRGAAAVLSRQGYDATSMKEIADEIGVSSGLLHYYFGTKEDLLTEVVRLQHDELIQEWRRAMAEEGAPLERVAAGMRRASDKFRSDPQFWHLQFDMYAIGLRTPRLRKRLRAMVRDLVQQIAEEVRRVTEEVPMPMPVPPEDIALAIAGAVDGIALLATVTDDDGQGAYRALLALVLSFTALGMISAGREVGAEHFIALLYGSPGPPTASG